MSDPLDSNSATRLQALNTYVNSQYSQLANGTITHLDLLANSIDFAVANVRLRQTNSSYSSSTTSTVDIVIGDLLAVFAGNGAFAITGRGQGPYWIGNDVPISTRRGATGFDSEFVDRTDQVQHVIGGLYGGRAYNSYSEWWAHVLETGDADEALNLITFAFGNSLTDGNIDDLSSALQQAIANNDSTITLGNKRYTAEELLQLLAAIKDAEQTAAIAAREPQRCFPTGTLVKLADGTEQPIETIAVGDEVLAFDHGVGFVSRNGIVYAGERALISMHLINKYAHSMFVVLATIAIGLFAPTTSAFAYMFELRLKKSITVEIQQKLPKSLHPIIKGAVYYSDERFLILQNRNPDFCIGKKCLTIVVPNCGNNDCQYAVAFTGTVFAAGDVWRRTSIAEQELFPLHMFCEIAGEPDRLKFLSSTFLVGKSFVAVSHATSEDCP